MSLFKKSSEWIENPRHRRIQLAYNAGLAEHAVKVAFQPNQFASFNTVFLLDLGRTLTSSLCEELNSNKKIESFIYEPRNLQNLMTALREITEFASLQSDQSVNVILNDWETVWYLFQSSFNNFSPADFLTQLKFVNDYANITITAKAENIARQVLYDWSNLSLLVTDLYTIRVEKSGFGKWNGGENISFAQLPKPEKLVSESSPVISKAESVPEAVLTALDKDVFDKLIDKLSRASNRDELLQVKKRIKSLSSRFSSEQKASLNDIYKIHLQRVKMIEDKNLNLSLNAKYDEYM